MRVPLTLIQVTLRAVSLFLCISTAQGAQFVRAGDYEIHYTTFSSMLIPPEVAAVHNITRAENRIVINISGRRHGEPASLLISGQVLNLLEQRVDLEFDEVREAEAIYYLASHTSLEHDILRFDLTITPPGSEPVHLEFLRRYD